MRRSKHIASGNPAVSGKRSGVDTEVRKLDQLRSAHVNQQHSIRLQLHRLPLEIAETQRALANLTMDIAKRDTHDGEEFSMTVGNREYFGKGAREEAAKALTCTRYCPGATTPPYSHVVRSEDLKS